jgi:hypothetical protein
MRARVREASHGPSGSTPASGYSATRIAELCSGPRGWGNLRATSRFRQTTHPMPRRPTLQELADSLLQLPATKIHASRALILSAISCAARSSASRRARSRAKRWARPRGVIDGLGDGRHQAGKRDVRYGSVGNRPAALGSSTSSSISGTPWSRKRVRWSAVGPWRPSAITSRHSPSRHPEQPPTDQRPARLHEEPADGRVLASLGVGPCNMPHMRYIAFSYSDSITTRPRLVAALATTLSRCPCCAAPTATRSRHRNL